MVYLTYRKYARKLIFLSSVVAFALAGLSYHHLLREDGGFFPETSFKRVVSQPHFIPQRTDLLVSHHLRDSSLCIFLIILYDRQDSFFFISKAEICFSSSSNARSREMGELQVAFSLQEVYSLHGPM